MENDRIVDFDSPILITGSNGFIGSRVVEGLLVLGFANLRCFVRPSSNVSSLERIAKAWRGEADPPGNHRGQPVVPRRLREAARDVSSIYHLAAGRGKNRTQFLHELRRHDAESPGSRAEKRRAPAFRQRQLASPSIPPGNPQGRRAGRIVRDGKTAGARGEAYCYAKVRQDEIVMEYGESRKLPYVIVRPGVVYGPGNKGITGRVGLGTFGLFLHLGGSNRIPLTYVDNCADAMVLAGIKGGVDGEVFNVVDDELPTSGNSCGCTREMSGGSIRSTCPADWPTCCAARGRDIPTGRKASCRRSSTGRCTGRTGKGTGIPTRS